jgi:hypothetical protein
MSTSLRFRSRSAMCVVMCESQDLLTLCLVWGLFVIMDNLQAMVVLDIIGIRFRSHMHGLSKN